MIQKEKTTTGVEKIQRLRGCFLTTDNPIYTTVVHGNGGGKSAGNDVFPNEKGGYVEK